MATDTTTLPKWRIKPCFYVSVVDPISNAGHFAKMGLLAGPFRTHKAALAWVDRARDEAEKIDRWAWFYAFGTCKVASGERLGKLNDRLGITIK